MYRAALATLLLLLAVAPNPVGGALKPSATRSSGPFCGINSLYAGLRGLGHDVSLRDFMTARYMGSAKYGSSIAELCRGAADNGAFAVPFDSISPSVLRYCERPVILHVKSDNDSAVADHFVLYIGERDGSAMIYDAPKPLRYVPFGRLSETWDGSGIVLSNEPYNLTGLRLVHLARAIILLTAVTVALFVLIRWRGGSCDGGRPRIVYELLVLLAVGPMASVAYHYLDPAGVIHAGRLNASITESKGDAPDTLFRFIEPNDLRALMAGPRVPVIIDARSWSEFVQSHIKGAINVSPATTGSERRHLLAGVTDGFPIVVYCDSEECPRAEKLARELAYDGFRDISVLRGGATAWISSGTKTSPKG